MSDLDQRPHVATTPPGWYPAGPGMLRYWNGQGWTSHTAPAAPPVPVVVVAAAPSGPNHILHLLLTVLTFGMWLPVWIVVAVAATRPDRGPEVSRFAGRGAIVAMVLLIAIALASAAGRAFGG